MNDDRPADAEAGLPAPDRDPGPVADPASGPVGPRRRRHRRAVGGTAAPGTGEEPTTWGRSRDDTDEDWGGRPVPDDDDRLLREVPPHW